MIKLINGLVNLLNPFDSKMDDSRNNIDIIGAISFPPGSMNQRAPNIPRMIGIKKNLINLLSINFDKK